MIALLPALTGILPLLIVAVLIAVALTALLLPALSALLILVLIHHLTPCGLISAQE
jgi:hypothetical protein